MRKITFALLWALVFTIPWEDAVPLPGIGTLSRVLGYAVLTLAVIVFIVRPRVRELDLSHVLMMFYLFWCIASYFWSVDPNATWPYIFTFTRVVGLAWLVWEFARTKREQLRLMQAYVAGCCVSMASLFFAAWQGRLLMSVVEVRYRGGGINEDDLALIFAISIGMAFCLATSGRALGRRLRVLYGLYCPVAAVGILLTGTRGGVIALLVGLLVLGLPRMRRSPKNALTFATALVVTLIVAQYIVHTTTIERLLNTGTEIRYGDWSERKTILMTGMEVFRDHSVLGVGIGAFAPAIGSIARAQAPHNTYLSVLVESGMIGFCLFLLILLRTCAGVWRMHPRERWFWVAILLMWGVGSLSVGWEIAKTTWFIFGLIAAVSWRDTEHAKSPCIAPCLVPTENHSVGPAPQARPLLSCGTPADIHL